MHIRRTDAKASALEKLKKTRKSKAARAADDDEYGVPARKSKARDYSDDDYTSDEDAGKGRRKKESKRQEVERATQVDLQAITLERWRFAKTWSMPWFEDYVFELADLLDIISSAPIHTFRITRGHFLRSWPWKWEGLHPRLTA